MTRGSTGCAVRRRSEPTSTATDSPRARPYFLAWPFHVIGLTWDVGMAILDNPLEMLLCAAL